MEFAERAARNEEVFRRVNEQIEEGAEQHQVAGSLPFHCECCRASCLETIEIPTTDYAAIMRERYRFVVLPLAPAGWIASRRVHGSSARTIHRRRPPVRGVSRLRREDLARRANLRFRQVASQDPALAAADIAGTMERTRFPCGGCCVDLGRGGSRRNAQFARSVLTVGPRRPRGHGRHGAPAHPSLSGPTGSRCAPSGWIRPSAGLVARC